MLWNDKNSIEAIVEGDEYSLLQYDEYNKDRIENCHKLTIIQSSLFDPYIYIYFKNKSHLTLPIEHNDDENTS